MRYFSLTKDLKQMTPLNNIDDLMLLNAVWVRYDFETFSACDLKLCGAWVYSQDKTTDILSGAGLFLFEELDHYIIELYIEFEPQQPVLLFNAINAHTPIYAWNAGFEYAIFKNVATPKLGWPEVKLSQLIDTLASAASLTYPLSLKRCAEVLGTELKDEAGVYLINKLSKARKTTKQNTNIRWPYDDAWEDYEKMYLYNIQDVIVELSIGLLLGNLSPEELKVHRLDMIINYENGIPLNRKLIEGAINLKEKVGKRITKEALECTDGFLSTLQQRDKILEFAKINGYEMENLQAATVLKALNDPSLPEKVRKVLLARKTLGLTSVSKYVKMLSSLDNTDRTRGAILYHVATTGRFGGRIWQPHNLPRPKVKHAEKALPLIEAQDETGLMMMFDDIYEVLASTIRNVIQPPSGKKFWISDFAGIEARVLGWVAQEPRYQKSFKEGLDLYKVTAAAVYKVSYEEVTDSQRYVGKQAVLGLGYSMGKGKFISMIEGFKGGKIDDELKQILEKAVDVYRKIYTNITKFWSSVEKATKHTITTGKPVKYNGIKFFMENRNFFIQLPNGRKLHYPDADLTMEVPSWGGDPRATISFMGVGINNKWVRQTTYGGKLTENIVQAIARDLLCNSMLKLHSLGFKIVMHIHDEVVVEVTPGVESKSVFMECMRDVPEWGAGIILDADFKESDYYLK